MPRINKVSDPSQVPMPEKDSAEPKVVLGLDLATNCGYCIGLQYKNKPLKIAPEFMGQWDLSAGPYDSGAIRFVRLRHFLAAVRPDLVGYEDVKFTPSEAITKFSAARVLARAATSSELIGAFRATVVTWCEENNIPCIGIPIGTIKKRATSKGNASKENMITACNEQFGSDFATDDYSSTGVDNIADAAWITQITAEQHSNGLE